MSDEKQAPQAGPDNLDALSIQLVAMHNQCMALGGMVQAALIAVQQLQQARGATGKPGALPPLTRERAGLPAEQPRHSFNAAPPAGPAGEQPPPANEATK